MERVQLTDELSFSRIIHGMWRLADWKYSEQELLQLIEDCLEMGITTFDHADIYGDYTCEQIFGKALSLKPEWRDRMQLVTKCGIKPLSEKHPNTYIKHYDTSKEHILTAVDQSLSNLVTDRIDVLLIHRPDPFMDPEAVAEAFTLLRQAGKVLHFGVSNFTPVQVDMLSSYLDFPLVTNQIEVNVMNLEHFDNGNIEKCWEKRLRPMIWSPLAGGRIFHSEDPKAGRLRNTLEQIADDLGADGIDQVMYAWLLQHPLKMMPIVGSGKTERIRRAVKALELPLTRQQWFEIWTCAVGHDVP
ncbi:oxidoreductase [Marinithermofilum abyssi]|uniref:Oxidoreductase n=1 Tax=Marinithermofilum abyssi TaxID=1571185 RepID=A0A8J2Y9I0_9BACL|nr:aldo/keto reductase [Marinithermofilum abyssi]GGE23199.1 oxidoreductase [Marinithermofilum abyssi]